MELIKLFSENNPNIPYYNPKFKFLAFECNNGNAIFAKILDSKVNSKNQVEISVSEQGLGEDAPEYTEMLIDDGWQYSDKIVISSEIKYTEIYPHYDIDKYSWSKKAIEDYAYLFENYKSYLKNSKFADFSNLSKYFDYE